jgi:hypothetical protein
MLTSVKLLQECSVNGQTCALSCLMLGMRRSHAVVLSIASVPGTVSYDLPIYGDVAKGAFAVLFLKIMLPSLKCCS